MSANTPASILNKSGTALTDTINKFASLIVELYRSINLKERLAEVKQYLQGSVCMFERADHQGQNGVQEEIEKAQTAADLIIFLTSLWSFYNHFLLSELIHKFCSADIKSELKKYINTLDALPVTEYPPLVQPYTNEECFHSDLLIVKVQDVNGIKGDTLNQIHDSITCWLNIESRVLLLKRIRKKTNELEYLIPTYRGVYVAISEDISFPTSFQKIPSVLSISLGSKIKSKPILHKQYSTIAMFWLHNRDKLYILKSKLPCMT